MCLLFLFWVLLACYVELNKDKILEKARTEIKSRIGGTLKIGQLDISLIRHFPSVSVLLTDVELRDSAWARHGHDLLKAERVYAACSLFRSLFHRRVELSTVFLEHATLYFYTDTSGYSNTYLLKIRGGIKGDSAGTPSNGQPDRQPNRQPDGQSGTPAVSPSDDESGALPTVVFSDVRWVIEKQDRHKLFDLSIPRLTAAIEREERELRFDVNTTIAVRQSSFNTEKGSFLQDKPLSGHWRFTYNLASHILQADKARINIDGYPFTISCRFFPTVRPDPFFLSLDAQKLPYRLAASFMTPHLRQKLEEYDIDKPVAVHAQLDAGNADELQPQIQVRLNLENGSIKTPAGNYSDVTFTGAFTNEWVHGKGHNDENSGLRFTGFTGHLESLPLRADSIVITNLTHPQMSCDLHSRFPVTALNDLLGSETLEFRTGNCAMDLAYKGPLSENDTAGATVNGQVNLDSAGIVYLPYEFALTHANGRILFKDQDMIVDHLDAHAGDTRIRIKGVAKNLIALLDHNSESVSMDWMLGTAHLAVEDFIALAGGFSSASGGSRENRKAGGPAGPAFGAAATRIDNFLKLGTIRVRFDATDLSYEDFSGAHAKADVVFRDGEIRLSQLTVEQNSGKMTMKATLMRHESSRAAGDASPLTLESHLEGVDLPGLFKSFDDFGLKGITSHNLKGKMDADIQLNGLLTGKGKLVPNSLKGTIGFRIAEGQLIDFEPMEKIHETVLKKRDMSEIHFGPLENELDIDSTTVTLHRMEIQSTAFTLYAEGTYDLKKGPDMALQVPLSNLKSRADDVPPESRGNDSKGGLSLHLRARTGDDGKLKISWDPFRKALKKAKQNGRKTS